ncbi:hypothetical protein L5515_016593 [Caenorhabditis briggsae]|uniref:Uncharacterized protein n=1 Tax=Caenorhabditis briggsae TaxID=6238 RepID=A0AAE9JQD3_CAEBR|nr:hypothetical protein L5515_016593 [Caenorhabditis briggsae]UMM39627.1 hypothetical protein L5515_016593 [Caenorhabditis briggsae]
MRCPRLNMTTGATNEVLIIARSLFHSEPSTPSEGLNKHKRISALPDAESALMGKRPRNERNESDFIEPLDPSEVSKAPAEPAPAKPAPKPAYGPHAVIKEIPEWIRKYEVFEEDLPKHGRPWLFPLDHYRPEGPKAPDPRFKLMDQYIEEMRKARGYDKETEDQAGTSGSSQRKKKSMTEAEKLMTMDFGPKAGGSLQDIEARTSGEKLCTTQLQSDQRKMLEESMDHPKLSMSDRVAKESEDLEPAMPSAASLASVSPAEEPLVNLDAPNTTHTASSSSVMDLPEDSDPLVQ